MNHAGPRGVATLVQTRLPFKEGFLTEDLADLDAIRLIGSRCGDCCIALLGRRHRCENCTSKNLRDEIFSPEGTVYSFTVQRYPPPEPHALASPWTARGLAWIDLNDNGPRIIGPVGCDPDQLAIGLAVRLACRVGWTEGAHETVVYEFVPVASPGRSATH